MKKLGKVLFVFGIIQLIIPFIVGSEYFINLFSIIGIISLAVALSIALAEKYIWLHVMITCIITGICLFSYIIGFIGIFYKTCIVFAGYMLVLIFMRMRKMILHRENEKI